MIKRFPDWPERLAAYLESRRNAPFEFGVHDCCTFACDAVKAQTGTDPMALARGKYKTEKGAANWLKRNGGDLEAAARKLGSEMPIIPAAFAGRGCVVLGSVLTPFGVHIDSLGLVGMDSRFALFAAFDGGWISGPVQGCRIAWGFD